MNSLAPNEEIAREETVSTEQDQLSFLQEHFKKKPEEDKVKYCKVGPRQWRINFWGEKGGRTNDVLKELVVVRSHYVVLTKAGKTWTYEILT